MKKLLTGLVIPFFLLFFSFNTLAEEPFKCTSHYKIMIENDRGPVQFDGRITLFLKNEKEGLFSLTGKVKTSKSSYLLFRTSHFSGSARNQPNQRGKHY